MRANFCRRYPISASHRLHVESFSATDNLHAYGRCNNPHGHGHNYVIEVHIGGEVDAATGMVINMAVLDEVVKARIVDRFDHTNLNCDPLFEHQVPTTENFCRAIFQLLQDAIPTGELVKIRIEETENNFFECAA